MNAESRSYTVVLTRGTHTVRADGAAMIFEALEAGHKMVHVELELYPGSEETRPATLVTAHVVAVSEVEALQRELVEAAGPKVRSLLHR